MCVSFTNDAFQSPAREDEPCLQNLVKCLWSIESCAEGEESLQNEEGLIQEEAGLKSKMLFQKQNIHGLQPLTDGYTLQVHTDKPGIGASPAMGGRHNV